jgi:hypothetical protein
LGIIERTEARTSSLSELRHLDTLPLPQQLQQAPGACQRFMATLDPAVLPWFVPENEKLPKVVTFED